MPSEIIRDTIIHDLTDSTAASVAALFPLVYPQASGVPVYTYLSIPTLLGVPASSIGTYVIANLGEANIPSSPAIIIQATEIYEQTAYPTAKIKNDQPGAECALVDIFVKNVRTATSVSTVKNVVFRLSYLLDYNLRQWRSPIVDTPGDLTINDGVDLSIHNSSDKDYFKCFLRSKPITLTSGGWIMHFEVYYNRSFPITYYY